MMSSRKNQFLFFPTPYPDEILYSVLCRYHLRCGKPSARHTNRTLWGNNYGKKLFLPDGIEKFANKIHRSANLTPERFIAENTIFPWMRPFLAEERGEELLDALMHGNPDTYNIVSFSKVLTVQPTFLRYCPQCALDDTTTYGETYWHRIHQLPGIHACPIHGTLTLDSTAQLNNMRSEYAAMPTPRKSNGQASADNVLARYSELAQDALWLLQNGTNLGYLEEITVLYDRWLRVKGYRGNPGKNTSRKQLAEAHVEYYSKEVLETLGAYNSGACSWIQNITQNRGMFQNPLHHMLLMRLLAGTAENFFSGMTGEIPVYKPYGEPPYPCRNVVCEHYLQDVIDYIEINHTPKGNYKSTFICPFCGFTYRRKRPLPKDEQYSGQIDVSDYGCLWRDKLETMLSANVPISKIGKALKCDTRTVVKIGIEQGYFPPKQAPKERPYTAHPRKKMSFDERRDYYRKRWLDVIKANPVATRNELRLIDGMADQWLHNNDAEWYERCSPPSLRSSPSWTRKDNEYAERIEMAIKSIRDSPGRPKHISVWALMKGAGIPNLYGYLKTGKLPKTQALIDANVETLEQWQRKKIHWAVKQMCERGEKITVYKVRHTATIGDEKRKWDGFITECILNSE
jgi:hypothetical protein